MNKLCSVCQLYYKCRYCLIYGDKLGSKIVNTNKQILFYPQIPKKIKPISHYEICRANIF